MGDIAILVGGTGLALALIALLDRLAPARSPASGDPSAARAQPTRPARTLRDGLRATREALAKQLKGALTSEANRFDRLEETLIGADVGVRTAQALVEAVRRDAGDPASDTVLADALRRQMLGIFRAVAPPARPRGTPHVILVTGVNGVGKTTTVAKLAARYRHEGRRVLVVAADTFRAAAADQLESWANRLGVDIVRHRDGGAPAAVVFDAMTAARARQCDVVLVDTAGRLHTRRPLVDELRKIRRVLGESVSGAPHETLLVVDATTGQNALNQARVFLDAVDVTGVVLTKLDGTARGGVALAIAYELRLPIVDVGVGETESDLRPFDAEEFVRALLP